MVTCAGFYEHLNRGEEKMALVGLGYVGMPVASMQFQRLKI